MSMIDIEKGVPMPNFLGGTGYRYPWSKMEVGDSFFVTDRTSTSVSGSATAAAKRGHGKFRCRTVEGGVRVWRVA